MKTWSKINLKKTNPIFYKQFVIQFHILTSVPKINGILIQQTT
jgi:hypothetical protein